MRGWADKTVSIAIVWFRRDLRLSDNPALSAALAEHEQVLPVYLHAPEEEAPWAPGEASCWWLHHALVDLRRQLGGRLLIQRGASEQRLRDLIARSGAIAVYWNRLYEPAAIRRDTNLKKLLRGLGVTVHSYNSALLFEPWEVANRQGAPFRVFSPFWKKLCAETLPDRPQAAPVIDHCLLSRRRVDELGNLRVTDLGLLPEVAWDQGIADAWQPSRAAAEARLDEFLASNLRHYPQGRDYPGQDRVSFLSAYLHFGQLGPREVAAASREAGPGKTDFMRELGWREFAYHQLYHLPHTTDEPMDPRFEHFPWREDREQLRAWQQARTGIPLVDAGMRQLWVSGWMHNRVRMVVASFLTKNLLLPWQEGARWFWNTLVDADLASNSLGWQWTAGSGVDAAPYFRVFNPVLQGERFDPKGAYVKYWLPQLAELPEKWLHRPWEAPQAALAAASVELGINYPRPIVDLKASRLRALDAWERLKGISKN